MSASTRRTITAGRQLHWKCRNCQAFSGWEVCVHSSPSAGRKIISFWKTRKREAEGFDNEALRIRSHCFASGLWVKSQGVSSPCLGGSIHNSKTQLPLADDDTGNRRSVNIHFQKHQDQWDAFLFISFLFFFPPIFSSSFSSASTTSTRILHYFFWLLWTTGNTLLLLVNQTQVHAMMQKSEINHSWICWRPQGWSDPRRSSFSQKVILVFCHYTFGV